MNCNTYVLLYTGTLSGHRTEYLSFASNILKGRKANIIEIFFRSEPVLFLMIEDSFLLYVISSLWRAVLKRKTAGLLFRPKPAVESNSFHLVLKRNLLKFLKVIPTIKTLLIVPETIHPKFSMISDGWIYDFQFWDVTDEDFNLFLEYKKKNIQKNKLLCEIQNLANNRLVVFAIGTQNRLKGFDLFLQAYVKLKKVRERLIFAFGGKTTEGFDKEIETFIEHGGFCLDRFVTNTELIMLYASSDLIWTLYSEEYDQASGIFGRAVQLGIPPIVRTGSLIHQICEVEDIPHISLSSSQVSLLSKKSAPRFDHSQGIMFRNYFRKKSIQQLNRALGININKSNE